MKQRKGALTMQTKEEATERHGTTVDCMHGSQKEGKETDDETEGREEEHEETVEAPFAVVLSDCGFRGGLHLALGPLHQAIRLERSPEPLHL